MHDVSKENTSWDPSENRPHNGPLRGQNRTLSLQTVEGGGQHRGPSNCPVLLGDAGSLEFNMSESPPNGPPV